MTSHWYALRSKPKQEYSIYSCTCYEDVECYKSCIPVNHVNTRTQKAKSYFPGQLFVQANLKEDGKYDFPWEPDSLGLVSCSDDYAVVPDNLICCIQRG